VTDDKVIGSCARFQIQPNSIELIRHAVSTSVNCAPMAYDSCRCGHLDHRRGRVAPKSETWSCCWRVLVSSRVRFAPEPRRPHHPRSLPCSHPTGHHGCQVRCVWSFSAAPALWGLRMQSEAARTALLCWAPCGRRHQFPRSAVGVRGGARDSTPTVLLPWSWLRVTFGLFSAFGWRRCSMQHCDARFCAFSAPWVVCCAPLLLVCTFPCGGYVNGRDHGPACCGGRVAGGVSFACYLCGHLLTQVSS